jgi:hypothetical protein
MIPQKTAAEMPLPEPERGRPERTAEDWLGRRQSEKKRLWDRLNPRHRREVRVIAQALALGQVRARLPEEMQVRLAAILEDLDRLAARTRRLLAELAQRAPWCG